MGKKEIRCLALTKHFFFFFFSFVSCSSRSYSCSFLFICLLVSSSFLLVLPLAPLSLFFSPCSPNSTCSRPLAHVLLFLSSCSRPLVLVLLFSHTLFLLFFFSSCSVFLPLAALVLVNLFILVLFLHYSHPCLLFSGFLVLLVPPPSLPSLLLCAL